MNQHILKSLLVAGLSLCGWPTGLPAQEPYDVWSARLVPAPTDPDTQRNAMNNVRSRVTWLKNTAQQAQSYPNGGDGMVRQALFALCREYATFTRTLTLQQRTYGANELSELAAGLDLLQEAYGNYNQDVAAGRYPGQALRDMCQIMRRAADVWLQEFIVDCARLRVGR